MKSPTWLHRFRPHSLNMCWRQMSCTCPPCTSSSLKIQKSLDTCQRRKCCRQCFRHSCCRILGFIGLVLLGILLYPLWLVFFVPYKCAEGAYKCSRSIGNHCFLAVLAAIIFFLVGLVLDAIWIPLALICTVVWLLYMIIILIICIVQGCRCK